MQVDEDPRTMYVGGGVNQLLPNLSTLAFSHHTIRGKSLQHDWVTHTPHKYCTVQFFILIFQVQLQFATVLFSSVCVQNPSCCKPGTVPSLKATYIPLYVAMWRTMPQQESARWHKSAQPPIGTTVWKSPLLFFFLFFFFYIH